MPKMKTNKSVAKRIKITSRGKLLRRRPGGRHLKSRKSPGQIRRYRKWEDIPPSHGRTIRRILGM